MKKLLSLIGTFLAAVSVISVAAFHGPSVKENNQRNLNRLLQENGIEVIKTGSIDCVICY